MEHPQVSGHFQKYFPMPKKFSLVIVTEKKCSCCKIFFLGNFFLAIRKKNIAENNKKWDCL